MSNASLSLVLRNLSRMKDEQEAKNAEYMRKHGEADYKEWEREHKDDLWQMNMMQILDDLSKPDEGADTE